MGVCSTVTADGLKGSRVSTSSKGINRWGRAWEEPVAAVVLDPGPSGSSVVDESPVLSVACVEC